MGTEPTSNTPPLDLIRLHESAVEMNEALILSSVRQHELTEAAERLNTQYQEEIAEHKHAKEALRGSEERYRTLFDLGPVAVYACDALGAIEKFNRRAVVLWGREPAPGDTDERFCGSFKLFSPDGSWMPHEQCPMADVVSGKISEVRDAEVQIERPDGSKITVIVNIQPLKDEKGQLTGAINCFYDITDRRLLEDTLKKRADELAQADRSKNEFLAMLAHELRNPLAPLRNAAEILNTSKASSEEWEHAQRIIARQIGNMTRMIDDLLDVSRITEGKIELRREAVGLEAILTSATSTMRSGIAAAHQRLEVSMPPDPIYLKADATRLEQVFVNLLGNASKYSGEGRNIWLSAERDGGNATPQAIVRIRDNGVGIDSELLPHVFDLFVQATRSLDRAHGGLGIGLTLVSRLVALHGGSIEARSEGLGKGAEFIVRLPMLQEAPPPGPAELPVAHHSASRRILIVDDNSDSARSLSILQTRRGHDTRTAFSGPEALSVAAEFLPEVVLLDIGLPGMDGFEVARQIRTMTNLSEIFLIAMTGYGSPDDRSEAKKAGFDEHLVKPLDLDNLEILLRDRLRKLHT